MLKPPSSFLKGAAATAGVGHELSAVATRSLPALWGFLAAQETGTTYQLKRLPHRSAPPCQGDTAVGREAHLHDAAVNPAPPGTLSSGIYDPSLSSLGWRTALKHAAASGEAPAAQSGLPLPARAGTVATGGAATGPDLGDLRAAHRHKTTIELLRTLAVFSACAVPPLVKHAESLLGAVRTALGGTVHDTLVRHTMFAQFCAGEGAEDVKQTMARLAAMGQGCILDYAVEHDVPSGVQAAVCDAAVERNADAAVDVFQDAISVAASGPGPAFVALKPTALANPLLLERASAAIREWERFLLRIADEADATSAPRQRAGPAIPSIRREAFVAGWVREFDATPAMADALWEAVAARDRHVSDRHISGHHAGDGHVSGRHVSEGHVVGHHVGDGHIGGGGADSRPPAHAHAYVQAHALSSDGALAAPTTAWAAGDASGAPWDANAWGEGAGRAGAAPATLPVASFLAAVGPSEVAELVPTCRSWGPLAAAALTGEERTLLARVSQRLDAVAAAAKRAGVALLVDAEATHIQPAIDAEARRMMAAWNREADGSPTVYQTYQMYLKDARKRLDEDRAAAGEGGWSLAAKLVRGAYMDSEAARAAKEGRPNPVHDSIEATHAAYDDATELLVRDAARGRGAVVVASHNADSLRKAMALCKELGVPRDGAGRVAYAQLLGMGDHLTTGIAAVGGTVLKYAPYGPVREVLPYLIRRAQENGAMLAALAKERAALRAELWSRML